MVFSCERVCGRARTMLRRVVEARTKKRGRLSFSDSALRHSRRRRSRACCSGVRGAGEGFIGLANKVALDLVSDWLRYFEGRVLWFVILHAGRDKRVKERLRQIAAKMFQLSQLCD